LGDFSLLSKHRAESLKRLEFSAFRFQLASLFAEITVPPSGEEGMGIQLSDWQATYHFSSNRIREIDVIHYKTLTCETSKQDRHADCLLFGVFLRLRCFGSGGDPYPI
jgi:hypothetical protein